MNIYIEQQAENSLNAVINECNANENKLFLLCDENTLHYCLPKISGIIPALPDGNKIVIPSGEKHKDLATCNLIWQTLLQQQADTHSVLICLGGGVVCDTGGFSAATFKRGIRHILIPTTLMAQVDAAIGDKTGVNFQNTKNQIGVYAPAYAICIMSRFLKTLPQNEILSGFAEMLKHGLIADGAYWQKLAGIARYSDILNMQLIQKSVHIKTKICGTDGKDENERHQLNFGHTIGHALESFSFTHLQSPLTHGHAVALGCIAESYLSAQKGLISMSEADNIRQVFNKWFSVPDISAENYPVIADYMQYDKKRHNQHLNCTLLTGIGHCIINQDVGRNEIFDALAYCLQ
ncbi:MAG: 3-dehydroquinate synthase [Bacteroidales bacterium]|nr:3-dehydroquinate synthase [Bacteroidales bacterium]